MLPRSLNPRYTLGAVYTALILSLFHSLQNESRLWKGWEQLEAEKLLFKEQQQTFEGERQKYLDAARRLDREVSKQHISVVVSATFEFEM